MNITYKKDFKSPRFCEPDKPHIVYGIVCVEDDGRGGIWSLCKYDTKKRERIKWLDGGLYLSEAISLLYDRARLMHMVKYPISENDKKKIQEEKQLIKRLEDIYEQREKAY